METTIAPVEELQKDTTSLVKSLHDSPAALVDKQGDANGVSAVDFLNSEFEAAPVPAQVQALAPECDVQSASVPPTSAVTTEAGNDQQAQAAPTLPLDQCTLRGEFGEHSLGALLQYLKKTANIELDAARGGAHELATRLLEAAVARAADATPGRRALPLSAMRRADANEVLDVYRYGRDQLQKFCAQVGIPVTPGADSVHALGDAVRLWRDNLPADDPADAADAEADDNDDDDDDDESSGEGCGDDELLMRSKKKKKSTTTTTTTTSMNSAAALLLAPDKPDIGICLDADDVAHYHSREELEAFCMHQGVSEAIQPVQGKPAPSKAFVAGVAFAASHGVCDTGALRREGAKAHAEARKAAKRAAAYADGVMSDAYVDDGVVDDDDSNDEGGAAAAEADGGGSGKKRKRRASQPTPEDPLPDPDAAETTINGIVVPGAPVAPKLIGRKRTPAELQQTKDFYERALKRPYNLRMSELIRFMRNSDRSLIMSMSSELRRKGEIDPADARKRSPPKRSRAPSAVKKEVEGEAKAAAPEQEETAEAVTEPETYVREGMTYTRVGKFEVPGRPHLYPEGDEKRRRPELVTETKEFYARAMSAPFNLPVRVVARTFPSDEWLVYKAQKALHAERMEGEAQSSEVLVESTVKSSSAKSKKTTTVIEGITFPGEPILANTGRNRSRAELRQTRSFYTAVFGRLPTLSVRDLVAQVGGDHQLIKQVKDEVERVGAATIESMQVKKYSDGRVTTSIRGVEIEGVPVQIQGKRRRNDEIATTRAFYERAFVQHGFMPHEVAQAVGGDEKLIEKTYMELRKTGKLAPNAVAAAAPVQSAARGDAAAVPPPVKAVAAPSSPASASSESESESSNPSLAGHMKRAAKRSAAGQPARKVSKAASGSGPSPGSSSSGGGGGNRTQDFVRRAVAHVAVEEDKGEPASAEKHDAVRLFKRDFDDMMVALRANEGARELWKRCDTEQLWTVAPPTITTHYQQLASQSSGAKRLGALTRVKVFAELVAIYEAYCLVGELTAAEV